MVKKKQIDWINDLYHSHNISDPDKIKRKLNQHAGMIGIFIIVLADHEEDQLEIYDSAEFMAPHMKNQHFIGLGMAKGYNAALTLVTRIAKDVYKETGDCKLKEYFQDKIREDNL